MTKTQWELAFDDWPGWRGNDPIRQAFQAGWDAALASHAPNEAAAQPTPIARYCRHCDNWREGTHPHGEIEHNDH